jgi:hypothetical protein
MLTHRAEGSRLEAKTALRGSVLQAISHLDGKAGIEASATAALNRSTLPRGRETRCWVPLPTCFVRSEVDGSEDVNLLAPCSADPDLPPLADRPPSPSLAASGA